MDAHLRPAPIIINGARWRGLRGAAGLALMLAGLGGAMASVPGGDALAPMWLAVAGLSAALGAAAATAPARLELSAAGLVERRLLRTRRWRWDEVYDFRPAQVGLASRTVGFSFTAPRSGPARWVAALSGLEAALAPDWELDPAALAARLNAARDRWVTPGAPPVRPHLVSGFAGARMSLLSYWLAAAALMGLTALFAVMGWWLAAALLAPFWARLYAGRLNDLGHSGWWQACAWAVGVSLTGALVTGGASQAMIANVTIGLWTVVTLGLGLSPGASGANRFGPAPGQLSPVATAEAFR